MVSRTAFQNQIIYRDKKQILDDYLYNLLKNQILVKPDRLCFLGVVFNEEKKKKLLPPYSNYKELFHEANFDYLNEI